VVVALERLHAHADQHRDREQDQFDERDRRELRQPVGRFGHGQRVVNAVEAVVALAPDEFGGIEPRDDIEEQGRAALDRLQHQIGHGPDVLAIDPTGESSRC
jgi:hypothetical protein